MKSDQDAHKTETRKGCIVKDYGVIVSLHSTSAGKVMGMHEALEKQYERYRHRVFENMNLYRKKQNYKDGILKNFKKKQAEFEWFYRPRFDYLWGKFDVLSLCLADSFSLSQQLQVPDSDSMQLSMHGVPNLPNKVKNNPWVVEPIKLMSSESGNVKKPRRIDEMPLSAFCKFKFNASLMMSIGAKVVRRAIQKMPELINPKTPYSKETEKNGRRCDWDDVRCMILEPLGWNEVSLAVYGRDYRQMTTPILKIRELRLGSILTTKEKNDLAENDLFATLYNLGNKSTEERTKFIKSLNVFSASWTVLGIEITLFQTILDTFRQAKNAGKTLENIFKEQARFLYVDKKIRGQVIADIGLCAHPGGLDGCNYKLDRLKKQIPKEEDVFRRVPCNEKSPRKTDDLGRIDFKEEEPLKNRANLMPGRNDAILKVGRESEDVRIVSTVYFLLVYAHFISVRPEEWGLFRHNTHLEVPIDLNDIKTNFGPFPKSNLQESLKKMQLGRLFHTLKMNWRSDKKFVARDAARILQLPRHLRSEIESIFNIYDSVVSDEVLLDSVIDFGPPLWQLIQYLTYSAEKVSLSERISEVSYDRHVSNITQFIKVTRLAFANRFNTSFPFSEISDYNMEFKGGIQHLLTSLDGVVANAMLAVEPLEGGLWDSARLLLNGLNGLTVIGEERQGVIFSLVMGAAVHKNKIELMEPETFISEFHEVYHHLLDRHPRLRGLSLLFEEFARHLHSRVPEVSIHYHAGGEGDRYHRLNDAALLEEISADQLVRDIVFGDNKEGDDLYRKWYALYYANTIDFTEKNQPFRRELVIRYILSLREPPSPEARRDYRVLAEQYKSEFRKCADWIKDEEILAELAEKPESDHWKHLALHLAQLDSLTLPWLRNEILISLADVSPKVAERVARSQETNETISVVELLFDVRRALYSPLQTSLNKKVVQNGYNPKDGWVGAFRREAIRTNPFAGLAYCRGVLNSYLKFILRQDSMPLIDSNPKDRKFKYKNNQPPIGIDPSSGLYSPSVIARREYFRASLSCLFTLWDLGLYFKGQKYLRMLRSIENESKAERGVADCRRRSERKNRTVTAENTAQDSKDTTG